MAATAISLRTRPSFLNQIVGSANDSVALAASVNPSKFGQGVTFTTTVTVPIPGAGNPTGTVTFYDGATAIGTGTIDRRRGDIHKRGLVGGFAQHHRRLQR